MHSTSYGTRSADAVGWVKTLAWAARRMYAPTEMARSTTPRHVAETSARAVIAIGAWLDAVIDREAAKLLPRSNKTAFDDGEKRIALLRQRILTVVRKVAGR